MFAKIKAFFSGRPEKKPEEKPVESKPAKKIDDHLRALLNTRTTIAASKLQIISLDKIKEYAGENWDGFADRARATIRETILRRLSPSDTYTQTDDNTYIIVFENLSKEDAELECVLIVQEVLQTLFIDKNIDDRVLIHTLTVGVDGKVDMAKVNLLDVIARLMDEESEKRENAAKSAAAPANAAPEIAGAPARKPAPPAMPRADMLDPDALVRSLPTDISFRYRPFWDVRRKVLSMYTCQINSGQVTGYDIPGAASDSYVIPALDFLTLGRVTHEIRQVHGRKQRLLLCCPVHFETLLDVKAWATYNLLCQRLARDELSRDVIFEVSGMPSIESEKIAYCLSKLQPFCRSITVRVPLSFDDFSLLQGSVCSDVGVDVSVGSSSEKRQFKMMDDFVEGAQNAGLRAQASGLASLSQVVGAVGAGFQKIGGDAIHGLIERPEFVYRFEAKNLLQGFA